MQCQKCSFGDPVGEAHYHIIVENGVVTDVWYMSADGYWDRDLEKDEYFVEYRKVSRKPWLGWKWQLPAIRIPKFGHSAQEDWLEPKIYKGSKAMHEEEDEDLS
jgi:hypothetical protein